MADTKLLTGGCQCGVVRYAVEGPVHACNLCHCRMCQKASGGPFMVFFNVDRDGVTWTRGERALFTSSAVARRGFCRDCGTPLTYESTPERISLSLGSLDDPSAVAPTERLGRETALPWSENVGALPITSTAEWLAAAGRSSVDSHQHPDRDT